MRKEVMEIRVDKHHIVYCINTEHGIVKMHIDYKNRKARVIVPAMLYIKYKDKGLSEDEIPELKELQYIMGIYIMMFGQFEFKKTKIDDGSMDMAIRNLTGKIKLDFYEKNKNSD